LFFRSVLFLFENGDPTQACVRELYDGQVDPKVQELGLSPPQFFSLPADGGGGPLLHGALFRPAG
jgi:hypothetical protein